jgi:hypothetical protein
MTVRNEPEHEALATSPDTDAGAIPLPQYHNGTEDDSVYDTLDEEEARRIQHWKDSPFAVGLVDVTWADSRRVGRSCQNISAFICPLLNAGRVGNMVVLKQSTEKQDEENIPRLDCIMGPHWVMSVCVTYPIILVVSAITAVRIVNQPWPLIIVWAILTLALLVALSMVACRNPGIMRRFDSQPDDEWRWNDQARTFRPKGAKYDPECAVVVESFDHTCPWTGTAIGKGNITAFRCFVGLLVVCLVMDIFLITSPFAFG